MVANGQVHRAFYGIISQLGQHVLRQQAQGLAKIQVHAVGTQVEHIPFGARSQVHGQGQRHAVADHFTGGDAEHAILAAEGHVQSELCFLVCQQGIRRLAPVHQMQVPIHGKIIVGGREKALQCQGIAVATDLQCATSIAEAQFQLLHAHFLQVYVASGRGAVGLPDHMVVGAVAIDAGVDPCMVAMDPLQGVIPSEQSPQAELQVELFGIE